MGCGRSVHGFAAIAQAADVPVDLTHDVQSHPLADCAALGTHEQSVFNQTAKFRAFLAYNANDLIFKEKIHIGGIFHIRGYSDIFHLLTFLDDNYGGGVGGVVRPCPPCRSWKEKPYRILFPAWLLLHFQAALSFPAFPFFTSVGGSSCFPAVGVGMASVFFAAAFSAFFISFIRSSKRSCRF